jgi:hypothetical protein
MSVLEKLYRGLKILNSLDAIGVDAHDDTITVHLSYDIIMSNEGGVALLELGWQRLGANAWKFEL